MNLRRNVFISCIFIAVVSMFITACKSDLPFSASGSAVPSKTNAFHIDEDVKIDSDYMNVKVFSSFGVRIHLYDIHYRGHDYLYVDGRLYHAPHCKCIDVDTIQITNIAPQTSNFNFNQ